MYVVRLRVAWPQKFGSINLKIRHPESCSDYDALFFPLTIVKMNCSYSSSERSGLAWKSRNTCSLSPFRLFRASAAVASIPPSSPTAVCAHQRAAAGQGAGGGGAAKLWHVCCGSCQGRYQQQMSRVGQHQYLLTCHVVDMNVKGAFPFKPSNTNNHRFWRRRASLKRKSADTRKWLIVQDFHPQEQVMRGRGLRVLFCLAAASELFSSVDFVTQLINWRSPEDQRLVIAPRKVDQGNKQTAVMIISLKMSNGSPNRRWLIIGCDQMAAMCSHAVWSALPFLMQILPALGRWWRAGSKAIYHSGEERKYLFIAEVERSHFHCSCKHLRHV